MNMYVNTNTSKFQEMTVFKVHKINSVMQFWENLTHEADTNQIY
jgi:hypothetical protein